MNIAVINLRDIIKYGICFIIILFIVSFGIKAIFEQNKNYEINEGILSEIQNSSFLYCLKNELALFSEQKKSEKEAFNFEKINTKEILNIELAMIPNLIEKKEEENNQEEIAENTETQENQSEDIELPKTNVQTKVIDKNNITASFNTTLDNVKIKNETKFNISDLKPNYELKNKNKVVIYHTHTCESYTSSDKFNYKMTGVYRTTDLNYTVSRVGDELEKYLVEYGKKVIHNKTYHDYPAYNGSYRKVIGNLYKYFKRKSRCRNSNRFT